MKNLINVLLKNTVSNTLKLFLGLFLLTTSFYFISTSLHFFKLSSEELGKYFSIKWILLLHITCGSLALITGPFQFWEELRNKNLKLHRMFGKIYIFSVWISGLCAVYLSLTSAYEVNGSYAFSLQVWVSVWLSSSAIGYLAVRLKKIKLHKEWMLRNYLVTLAFVISALLLKVPLINNLGSFAEVSPSLFWVSWAVPLFIYDVYLSYQRKQ